MKKQIISISVLFALLFNGLTVNAGVNVIPEIDKMIKDKQHDAVEEYIRQEEKIENTVSTVVRIDENDVMGPAYGELFGHGTEAFNFLDEVCLDKNGEISQEYIDLCNTDFYDAPVARFGGGGANPYSLINCIGSAQNRKTMPWILSKEDTELFHPTAVHECSYGEQATQHMTGTIEYIKEMQVQNPDIQFIFSISLTHESKEDVANFARFCLDDPSESYWGQLRADYGLDKINVLAFEAGNEVYINNPKYTKPWFDDRVSWYIRTFKEYADEIHKYHPEISLSPSIMIGTAGSTPNEWWTRPIIEELKDYINYVSIHSYYCGYEIAYVAQSYIAFQELLNEVCGPGHGIQALVTEHSKWMYGTQFSTAGTLESALSTAQFISWLYSLPDSFIRAATYYSFTSEKMWALMRRNYDGSLTTSGVGKVMGVYYNNLGDRVIQTTSIPQDDSLICEKSSTAARFSVQAFGKGKKQLKIIMTNRENNTAVDINFEFLKNKYTLKEETVFTAPRMYSFVYGEKSRDIFTTTTTPKNEPNFSHYVMPNKCLVVLTLESTSGNIPQIGGADDFGEDGIATFDGEDIFSDIGNHWANAEINNLAAEKVISGSDGAFSPDNKISKAEFASMVCNLVGTDKSSDINVTDVSKSDWYYDYVKTFLNRGYLRANNNLFCPDGEISLKDAVTVLYRICSAKKNDTKIDNLEAVVSELGIKSQLNGWEKEAFAYALKNKFLTEFYEVSDIGVQKGITRAEAAVLIYRLQNHLGITIDLDTEVQ